jgi:nitroreductase
MLPANTRVLYSAVSAGAISQNVYLYCASAGLATVVRGWFDGAALAAALRLTANEQVVLTQTVGFPEQ